MRIVYTIISFIGLVLSSYGQVADSIQIADLDSVVVSSNSVRITYPTNTLIARQLRNVNPTQSLTQLLQRNTGMFIRSNGASGLSTLTYKGLGSMQSPIVIEGANVQSSMNGTMDLSLIDAIHFNDASIGQSESTNTGAQNMGEAISLSSHIVKPKLTITVASSSQLDKELVIKYSNLNAKWSYSISAFGASSPNKVNLEHYGIDSFQRNTDYTKISAFQKVTYQGVKDFNWTNSVYFQISDRAIPARFRIVNDSRQQDFNLMMVNGLSKKYKVWNIDFTNQLWREEINFIDDNSKESYLSEVFNVNSTVSMNRSWNQKTFLRLNVGNENAFYSSKAISNDAQWNRLRASYFLSHQLKDILLKVYQQVLVYDSTPKMSGFISASYKASKKMSVSARLEKVFRLPTLNELFWYQPGYALGNSLLKPEDGYKGELTFRLKSKAIEISVNPYFGSYQNWIQWVGFPEIKPKNFQAVMVRGTIINAVYSKWIRNKRTFIAKTNVNWTKATYSFDDKNDSRHGKQIIYTPEVTASLFLGLLSDRYGVHINQYVVGDSYYSSDNTSSIDPYFLTEIGGFYKWKNLKFGLVVSNLLDQPYYTQPNTPMPGQVLKININYIIPITKWKEK